MATSGSVNFTLTRDQLITTAYKKCGLIQKSETPTADEISFAADILNLEVKMLTALNPHIWKRRVGYLFPEKDQFQYKVGTQAADDNIFNSYVTSTLTAAAVATDTTITINDITGISNTDIIGVVLDAGTIHWTTVNGSPAGSTITLTDAMPSGSALYSRIYVGSSKISRPVKIYNAWRETITTTSDTITRSPLEQVAYDDFYRLYGSQRNNSTASHYMFDNRAVDAHATEAHGIIHIQPTTNQSIRNEAIGFIYETQIEDFDADTDNADLPSEWLKLLVLGICKGLATSDGVPERIAVRLENEYRETLDLLLQNDADDSTLFFEPSYEEQDGYYDR